MQNATHQQHSQTLQSATLVDVLEHERRKNREKREVEWRLAGEFKVKMDEQLDAAKCCC